jgi:thiamine biosynthesis protein ThiS
MVRVRINGDEESFDTEPTIRDVLDRIEAPPAAVAVEVNRRIVPRSTHAEHVLQDGDEVEVVTFVGGG